MRRLAWVVLATVACVYRNIGFEPSDYAFLLSAQASGDPPKITISWPQKQVFSISVKRKRIGDTDWGPTFAKLKGAATTFEDDTIERGVAYEYQFSAMLKKPDDNEDEDAATAADPEPIAYGYICAGAEVPAVESRGKIALLVDNRFSDELRDELETLRKDLIGDGWSVVRHDVSLTNSIQEIKALIKADYAADAQHMRAVFLFGHVPVPYSGLLNPDMHAEHIGAWPADVFYGDVDGLWTDESANKTDCEFDLNNNIPGDGKFDQSQIPSAVELEVGRVDMWDLPSFAPLTESALLRNYLRKDHEFRHTIARAPTRGLIRDNFGIVQDDAPAVDAWRAFPALFGPNSCIEVGPDEFFPTLRTNRYLWAFGCGGGDRDKADGVGWTEDFAAQNPQAVFYLLHGSWFGDWNTSDNFLRAAIATPNDGLVSIWSSLPHWFFHHLAMGETIGFATRLIQNNQNGLYQNDPNYSAGQVHISMMGDPTLHPFPVAPPANVRVRRGAKLQIQWDPSSNFVAGYNVYRATSFDASFEKLNVAPITNLLFETDAPPSGHYIFMVRATTLQTTGSGTFWNLSQGAFADYDLAAQFQSIIVQPILTASGAFEFQATGFPNRPFTVESRAPEAMWTTLASGTSPDDGVVTYRETISPTNPAAFYRVTWK